MKRFSRWIALAAFAFLAVVLTASQIDARPGGGGSFGSRGMRTWSAPAPTQTAPRNAAPIERSMTQPQQRPGQLAPAQNPAAQTGGLFGRPGFLGGLAAGFLGAGLLGMLFGGGFGAGLGSFASVIGLILQIALVVIVARLLWTWWQRRNAPSYATAGGPSLRNALGTPRTNPGYGSSAPLGAGAAASVAIEPADFDTFERLLNEVSVAYGEGNLGKLRSLATPEMLSYFSEDLSRLASEGLRNEVSGIKLLQGDLAEAWREGDTDYATVAMRYAIVDAYVDAQGNVVRGSREPQEVTELWTFLRSRGGNWILSAIQQV
ncbi:MAG: TIM44-like domain-containing protein [Pseudorhodoplanes sp.]|nr:TIM44-like domain-containing protein [Pseudorhodoplanes sp.]